MEKSNENARIRRLLPTDLTTYPIKVDFRVVYTLEGFSSELTLMLPMEPTLLIAFPEGAAGDDTAPSLSIARGGIFHRSID